MSQFNLERIFPAVLASSTRKFSTNLKDSSVTNGTALAAASFVSKCIDDRRQNSLETGALPKHIVDLISKEAQYIILRDFISQTVISRSWKIDTFEKDSIKYINNLWDPILTLDSNFKLPKGRHAPYLYKVIANLAEKMTQA